MSTRWAFVGAVVVSLADCYAPDVADCTIRCSAEGACPSGQRCDHGFCTAATACRADDGGGTADRSDDVDAGKVDVSMEPDVRMFDVSNDAPNATDDGDAIEAAASDGAPIDGLVEANLADRAEQDVTTDGPPSCEPLALPFPSTPVLDDMNRTELGPNWLPPAQSTFELNGSTVKLKGGAPDASPAQLWPRYDIFFAQPFIGTQEAYVTFLTFAGTYIGVELHNRQNICDWFLVMVRNLGDIAAVGCGRVGLLKSKFVPLKSGDVVGARLQTNGCLEVYAAGQLVFAIDVSNLTTALEGPSRIGVYSTAGPNTYSEWDDFGGGAIP